MSDTPPTETPASTTEGQTVDNPTPQNPDASPPVEPPKGETNQEQQPEAQAEDQAPPEVEYLIEAVAKSGMTKESAEWFKDVAKRLQLTKEQAEGLWQETAKRQEADLGAFTKAQKEAAEKSEAEYREAQKAALAVLAKTFGKDVNTMLDAGKKAMGQMMTADQAERLAGKGFLDDPDVVAVFAKVGLALAEDTLIYGAPGGGPSKSMAQVLYPNLK